MVELGTMNITHSITNVPCLLIFPPVHRSSETRETTNSVTWTYQDSAVPNWGGSHEPAKHICSMYLQSHSQTQKEGSKSSGNETAKSKIQHKPLPVWVCVS